MKKRCEPKKGTKEIVSMNMQQKISECTCENSYIWAINKSIRKISFNSNAQKADLETLLYLKKELSHCKDSSERK